jgi:heme o synthase
VIVGIKIKKIRAQDVMIVFNSQFIFLRKWAQIYAELSKWRVTSLMLFTAWVGMELASPTAIPSKIIFFTLLGIALIASAAASLNHLLDAQRDRLMARTHRRPLPLGKISNRHVVVFAIILGIGGTVLLSHFANPLTTWLSLASLFGYAIVYTLFLKQITVQNIVIGGLAGASPPLLGWTAATGHIESGGLLLMLIIFIWTPPHFWSLAIARHKDYVKSKLPILSVTHGIAFTKHQILLYIVLLSAVTLLPFSMGVSGIFYLGTALFLNAGFMARAICLLKQAKKTTAIKTFHYSNFYLLTLFICLFIDHALI